MAASENVSIVTLPRGLRSRRLLTILQYTGQPSAGGNDLTLSVTCAEVEGSPRESRQYWAFVPRRQRPSSSPLACFLSPRHKATRLGWYVGVSHHVVSAEEPVWGGYRHVHPAAQHESLKHDEILFCNYFFLAPQLPFCVAQGNSSSNGVQGSQKVGRR